MLEGVTKKGEKIRIVKRSNGLFRVVILKINYVHGRNIESWKLCAPFKANYSEIKRFENGVEFNEAKALFDKRAV